MGNVLQIKQLNNQEISMSILLVYANYFQKFEDSKSISKELADGLLACAPKRRSMRMEDIFCSVIKKYPDDVVIKDIDVMFNPEYKIDVLKILISARKIKKYNVIWPGRIENEKLIYGEKGFPDYKEYDITDYDITFVK